MSKNRLEAFSDGVIAIIITIMVLELKVPHGDNLDALLPLIPIFLSYVLSFIYVGIYWNNHHHLLHTVEHVNGPILWANLHLLFWLSIVPFGTSWLGENEFAAIPAAVYGVILFMNGISYLILELQIISAQGSNSLLRQAIGNEWKGKLSIILYAIAVISTFWSQWIAIGIYVFIAIIWFIPDQRIERIFLE